MIKKSISMFVSLVAMLIVGVSSVSAHASITQKEVGVGLRTNFTLSVPTEEVDPTTEVRLVLPDGLKSVMPMVKPGWNIQLKKSGEGEDAKITEIIWSGGRIPTEQRDEFVFNAQAPAEETSLIWKTYQTYGDGDIVAWENDPKVVAEYSKNNPPKEGEDDHNAPRPWSETKVINDLKASSQPQAMNNNSELKEAEDGWNTWIGIIALTLSVVSIGMQVYNKNSSKKS
jgi:uncharacterized protein YcnI